MICNEKRFPSIFPHFPTFHLRASERQQQQLNEGSEERFIVAAAAIWMSLNKYSILNIQPPNHPQQVKASNSRTAQTARKWFSLKCC